MSQISHVRERAVVGSITSITAFRTFVPSLHDFGEPMIMLFQEVSCHIHRGESFRIKASSAPTIWHRPWSSNYNHILLGSKFCSKFNRFDLLILFLFQWHQPSFSGLQVEISGLKNRSKSSRGSAKSKE